MSIDPTPAEAIQDWRERTAAVVHDINENSASTKDGVPVEIDVYDLMGMKGRILELPSLEGVLTPGDIKEGYTPNSLAVTKGARSEDEDDSWTIWAEDGYDRDHFRARVTGLLGELAGRWVEEAIDPINRAIDDMREPIRTVAINLIYGRRFAREETPFDTEELARRLGTSAETIEWLRDVAMDMLAQHVEVTIK